MPLPVNEPKGLPDVRVHIRNREGKYLAGREDGLYFTEDRATALVLCYEADQVAAQLENIQRTQGVRLEPVPVPLEEIYETCDRCQELFMPVMTFFDGKRFLCAECGRRLARRAAPPHPRRGVA